MSLSDRDKKIVFLIVPIVAIVGYWFLMLAPKREEASKAADEVTQQQQRVESAQAQLAQASTAKTDFTGDYSEIVRLGKAIPAKVDMPSLIVQLESAARGTGIRFTKIGTGERTAAAPPATAGSEPPAGSGENSGATPAQAGGQPAQSGPGTAAEAANTAAAASEQRNGASEQSGSSRVTPRPRRRRARVACPSVAAPREPLLPRVALPRGWRRSRSTSSSSETSSGSPTSSTRSSASFRCPIAR